MSGNLLDILKNGTKIQTPGAAVADQETNQLQQLAQAKTGKAAGPSSGPKMSNLGAQSAAAQGQAQATLQNQAFDTQAQGLIAKGEAQDQQAASVNAQLTEQGLASREKLAQETQDLIQTAKNQNLSLDQEQDRAKLEQIGFMSRLSSEKYIEQLQREGELSRLGDQNRWEEAYLRSVFGSQLDLLKQKLGNEDIMNIDQNEFNQLIETLDIDFAIQIASGQNKAANQQTQYEAGGNIVSGLSKIDYSDKTEET